MGILSDPHQYYQKGIFAINFWTSVNRVLISYED